MSDLCAIETAKWYCPVLDFLKTNWKWQILILVIVFILIRTKKRGYFWKVKKTGEQVKFKDFLKKWKKGVEGITPYQQSKSQVMGNIIVLIGIISGIIINCLTRVKNQWVWLVIVLLGSLVLTSMSQVSYLQKYWRLKQIDNEIKKLEKIEEQKKRELIESSII